MDSTTTDWRFKRSLLPPIAVEALHRNEPLLRAMCVDGSEFDGSLYGG